MKKTIIINAAEIVTCSGSEAKKGVTAMNDLGIITDGAIIIDGDTIEAVGNKDELMKDLNIDDYNVIDATGKSVLPGFIDSHTHFIFGGYRAEEFSWRLRGDSYMDIMNRGGGIVSSVTGTKEASLEELVSVGLKRLDSMVGFGVTTVEGKSGYGLDYETEMKQLEAMKLCDERHPIGIAKTFLGAHAVPKDYKGREDEFVDEMIGMLPEIKEKELAEFCDIFCEQNVFTVEQSRRLLTEAQKLGLKAKIHADEIVRIGGADLAGEIKAVSADHLLQASDEGLMKMKENGVVATLLPGTAFSLKEHYARGRFMIDSGLAVAIATDFNPGSCHTESIPLIIALSALYMKLTPEEIVTALTINGAAAIDKADELGSIDPGKKADIVIHEFPSYKYLPYHIGVSTVERVIKDGKLIYDKTDRNDYKYEY